MAKKATRHKTITDQLREAIRESGLTHYRLGKDSGVDIAAIDRFVAGREPKGGTIDRLARILGLELRPRDCNP